MAILVKRLSFRDKRKNRERLHTELITEFRTAWNFMIKTLTIESDYILNSSPNFVDTVTSYAMY